MTIYFSIFGVSKHIEIINNCSTCIKMKQDFAKQTALQYTICLLGLLFSHGYLFSQKKAIVIQGYVFTKEEKIPEPVINASVMAYGHDSVFHKATITDLKGFFKLETEKIPVKIIIRCTGYEPCVLQNFAEGQMVIQTDTCFLTSNNMLAETVVKASAVSHSIGADSYLITKSMREKASNTLELLGQMHGVRYDKLTNSIRINNGNNVLFIIDNKEQSKDYILNLSPERIAKIEINRNPKGKYMSEGYDAVINVILKKDYLGCDIGLSNFTVANLGNNNGSDKIVTDQPNVNIVYTKKKFNFFANYTYGFARWNSAVEKNIVYAGTYAMESSPIKTIKPNDLYGYHGNVASGGLNYHLSPNHTLSFEANYSKEIIRDDNKLDYEATDLTMHTTSSLPNDLTNKTNADNLTTTLFYNGKFNEHFSAYGDMSYNNYSNSIFNFLRTDKDPEQNAYDEKRHILKFSLNTKYIFTDKLNLSFGCSTDFRKYTSDNGSSLFTYKESRYKAFAYFQYKPSEKLNFEAGLGGERAGITQETEHNTFFKLLPSFLMNYNVTDAFNLKASYLTNMEYPMLAQLNPASTFIDKYMQYKGNPNLKSNLIHTFSADFNLWDRMTFTPQMKIAPNMICDLISKDGSQFINSFYNIHYKEYSFQLVYDQPIGKNLSFSNSVTYYRNSAKYEDTKKNLDGWLWDSELNYMGKHNLMLQLGYHKSMDKQNKVQGYQMHNFDSWTFSLNRKIFHDKVSLMLMYMLPLKLGVSGLQEKRIQTPVYSENYNIDMKPYRNTLVFRLTYRFHKGNSKMEKNKSSIEKNERINRTVDF